jgi:hypothetical protein
MSQLRGLPIVLLQLAQFFVHILGPTFVEYLNNSNENVKDQEWYSTKWRGSYRRINNWMDKFFVCSTITELIAIHYKEDTLEVWFRYNQLDNRQTYNWNWSGCAFRTTSCLFLWPKRFYITEPLCWALAAARSLIMQQITLLKVQFLWRFQAGFQGILALVVYGSAMIVIFSSPLSKYPTTNIGRTDGNNTITLN